MRKITDKLSAKIDAQQARGLLVSGFFMAGVMTAEAATLNINGVTGLVDMPSGEAQPDGELSLTMSHFGGITRTTLNFQISPRLSGTFRYTGISDWNFDGFDTYFDRSFDLRYHLIDEGRYIPSVTIGLQDIAGTGLYSGEYIAATKSLSPKFKVTAGLGWGRLGSYGSVGSFFGTRPAPNVGEGGKINADLWFRGPAAVFGGMEWQATDRLTFKAEYSSDAYELEATQRGVFTRRSPFNFGLEYKVTNSFRVGAYSLYGSQIGVMASLSFNPSKPPNKTSVGTAPLALVVRPNRTADPEAWSGEWVEQTNASSILRNNVVKNLAAENITLESMRVTAHTVDIRIRNTQYDATSQAIGRSARALTRTMPASVEVFKITPVVNGIAASTVTIKRSDLERFEHAPNGAAQVLENAIISDASTRANRAEYEKGVHPRFTWGFSPYLRTSLFDPDNPVRADVGLRLSGRYELSPQLVFSGSISKKLVGNLDSSTRISDSVLPHVRTDFALYDKQGDPALETLKLDYFFRPGKNLYGRVSLGYLERMYGGISTELLWKPVSGRLAFGAEVNYVRQRDFDTQLGFQNYDVITGHVSAYYELGKGYHAQLDAGRYLAGDYGATFSLNREFANGWKVGAFATLTDVSSTDFGEGSFDKGIRIDIPMSWLTGKPSQTTFATTIRPITRDGGARLEVGNRLYEQVRGYHKSGLERQWGRFWR